MAERPEILTQASEQILRRLGGAADAERFRAPPAGARDRTAELDRLRDGAEWDEAAVAAAFARVRPRLQGLRFLFMPCYLSDFLKIPKKLKLTDYFDAQTEALRAAGIAAETVDVNSQDTIESNARSLRQHLIGHDDRVFIVSHSKGGLDTLELLLHSDAELVGRIAGWLPHQAPFGGSPVADRVAQIDPVRRTAESLLNFFGGSGGSLHDLRTDVRAHYMRHHAAAVRQIVRRVPTLAVTTAVDEEHPAREHTTATYPTLVWMREQGIRSDGIVPTHSMILPETPYVVLAPVDHTGMVSKGAGAMSFRDRVLLTQALIALLLGPDTGSER